VRAAIAHQPVITIDGPAGAGKSTAARELARRLGFRLVDTGALYRGLAWAVHAAGVDPGDAEALARVLERTRVELVAPLQRALAAPGGVILEGRDTGTVVWPEAEVKFYLDADLETRARRRRQDLLAQGVDMDLAAVAADVARRDRQDSDRALAPLRRPRGAVVLDTTRLGLDQVVDRMRRVVEQARCCTEC
jgi:cytidylate kinase